MMNIIKNTSPFSPYVTFNVYNQSTDPFPPPPRSLFLMFPCAKK